MQDRAKPYPHVLIGVPRALLGSAKWRALTKGARYYFLHLLTRSNTRTFKDVFPGSETIEEETGIDTRTRRRYEKELIAAQLIRIIPPGRPDRNGITRTSRRICFRVEKYMNADFRAINEKEGSEIYPPVRDLQALEERLEKMAQKQAVDIQRIDRKIDLIEAMLNQVAQRIQITGTDDRGNVHLTLHSEKYTPEFVQDALPSNVLVFPSKKNADLVIDSKQSWEILEKRIARELENYRRRRKMQPLFDVLESFSEEQTKKQA